MTVLRLLRTETRKWWYHKQLRDWGNIAEANKRERHSIRQSVEHLRKTIANGGCLWINDYGRWILFIGRYHTLSGYGDGTDGIPAAAKHLGIKEVNEYPRYLED